MAAEAAVGRSVPAHPGPNEGNIGVQSNSSTANPVQQDPGSSSHPQQPVFARPFFYIPTPPPPPFLPYQWPMPITYNPFAGFPGMGYGMVMPPPYMDAPVYVLPPPRIQPVDYRRLHHPQVHAPGAPHRNPNQARGDPLLHAIPVRETVNSEVQTEPTQRSYNERCSESGHGTASSSPSSLSSTSQKQGSVEAENKTGNNPRDTQVNRPSSSSTVCGSSAMLLSGKTTVQSRAAQTQRCKDSIDQEPPLVPSFRNGHINMWSGSSVESMVPVCSSSQREDDVTKERRLSVPDILMMKMADKVLLQTDHHPPSCETEVPHESSVFQSPPETRSSPVMADSTTVDEAEGILRSKDDEMLPSDPREPFSESTVDVEPVEFPSSLRCFLTYRDELLQSLNASYKLPGNEMNPEDDSQEISPNHMSISSQVKRKINESLWSVESLEPYIPSKEWLQQNGVFLPEVIVEEETENGRMPTLSDNLTAKPCMEKRHIRMFSSSDSVPMSESRLVFSTPAERPSSPKKYRMESVTEMKGPEQVQSVDASEKHPLVSPTPLQNKTLSTSPEKDVRNRSSEPEACQSPNQEFLKDNEQQQKSPCSPEKDETSVLNIAGEEKSLPTVQLVLQNGTETEVEDGAVSQRNEELSVPGTDGKLAQVLLSKGHPVDCGIQCTDLCECKELMDSTEQDKRDLLKNPDVQRVNNGAEVSFKKGHMEKNWKRSGNWRHRHQERQSIHQEPYTGHCDKPGKTKGGNGRNSRH